jgi:hypothetical protein
MSATRATGSALDENLGRSAEQHDVVEAGMEPGLVPRRALHEQHARLLRIRGEQCLDPVLAPKPLAIHRFVVAAVVGVDCPIAA